MQTSFLGRAAVIAAAVLSLSGIRSATAQGGLDGNGTIRPDPGAGVEVFESLVEVPRDVLRGPENIRPSKYTAVRVDIDRLVSVLRAAPLEGQPGALLKLSVPMPDGSRAIFELFRTQVLHPQLEAKFPGITTYAGNSVTPGGDYGASAVFDLTPMGFHAQILAPSGTIYIDPLTQGDTEFYGSYYIRDHTPIGLGLGGCQVVDEGQDATPPHGGQRRAGPTLRRYDLAVAATAEYTAANGGTVASALANITTTVNRVIGVYIVEAAITFQLVANNNLIIYTNSVSDPYDNASNSNCLAQNVTNLNNVILTANYDIGHVFTTTGGGIANLSGVCNTSNKARGASGSLGVNDWFTTFTVLHEMGHQFSARHTFNTESGSCAGNRDALASREPGAGSTIMAYPVQCSPDVYVAQGDFYFHSDSFDRIISFAGAATCDTETATGNIAPVFGALSNVNIPAATPFDLDGSATDANGDALTYMWEDRSLGAAATLAAGDNGASPIIRSRPATGATLRPIPALANLLANNFAPAEILPTVARTIVFRGTARDNRATGGGVNTVDRNVTVVNTGAPFAVTSPNGGETLLQGPATVTWNVAGTTAAPISTSTVRIRLSTDGGITFPIDLGTTANDGSATVTMPELNTANARIRIEATNSIYFDVSNGAFNIRPLVQIVSTGIKSVIDTTGNGNGNAQADPGESELSLFIQLRNDGAGTATGISGTLTSLTPTVTVSAASSAWSNLGPGASANNTTAFVIAVDPSHVCGDPIHLSLLVSATEGGGGAIPVSLVSGGGGKFVFNGAVPIPDGNVTGVDIPIEVSGVGGVITGVTLSIDGAACGTDPLSTTSGLNHAKLSDVQMYLIAPNGIQRTIINRPGTGTNTGINLCQALFVDDNTFPVLNTAATALLAPYSGSWRPSQAMTILNGQPPNGTWKIRVIDAIAGNTGTFRSCTLTVIGSAPVCDPPSGGVSPCNLADVTGIGGAGAPADGQLTVDDVIEFVNAFSDGTGCPGAAPCNLADVTGIGGGGAAPDGELTVDDVIEFFNAFSDGCP